MPDRLPGREMYPDLRIVLNRRVGHESYLVALVEVVDVSVPACEHRPVYRRSEARRLAFGERRTGLCHAGEVVGREDASRPPV